MHLVELFLQVFHLLFDRLFLVNILVVRLVRVFRVISNLGDLNVFVNRLFHQLDPLSVAVHGEDVIALLVGQSQPERQGAGDLAD